MHVVFVGNHYKKGVSSLKEWIEKSYTTHEIHKVFIALGHTVTVVQRFPTRTKKNILETYDGINYVLVEDFNANNLPARKYSLKIIRAIKELDPDVVHAHNMRQLVQNYLISRMVDVPVVVQNHAEQPFNMLKGARVFYKHMSSFLFSAPGQETVWTERNLLTRKQCQFVMEGSSHFQYDQELDKRNLSNEIRFFWTGNLNLNKDPLLILSGLERVFTNHPNAKLYMAFKSGELLQDVKQKINSCQMLASRVELLGELNSDEIKREFHKSHFFVQGSHFESCGFSLIEALTAGVVPVVTNIPSFKAITANGKIGRLFEPDDIEGLMRGINDLLQEDWHALSKEAFRHFEQNLSFKRIAEDLISVYQSIAR